MDHKNLTLRAFDKLEFTGNKILDVGCRDDSLCSHFEDKGFKWIGCDKVVNVNVNVVEGMMESLPFDDNAFDILFVCHSFEHTERPAEALREFRRVLKVGGTLFISTPLHCEHQVIGADADHINVLTHMQMQRYMIYTNFKLEDMWVEQNDTGFIKDDSLITICKKKE